MVHDATLAAVGSQSVQRALVKPDVGRHVAHRHHPDVAQREVAGVLQVDIVLLVFGLLHLVSEERGTGSSHAVERYLGQRAGQFLARHASA